ncbi:MAG: hypothetical protein JWN40_1442 [Phycisphaerales bacterium]|jgi:hypothetical protein|nr:hypothetical protein [Phycisphaerales bacterium]
MPLNFVDAVTRAVCWSAGLVEGLVSGLLEGGSMRRAVAGGPFPELRAALLGRDRRQIMRALGAPPTATVGFGVSVVTGGAPLTFWQAPTWYYPFDPGRRQAIAIRFVGDRAQGVDFIGAPAE